MNTITQRACDTPLTCVNQNTLPNTQSASLSYETFPALPAPKKVRAEFSTLAKKDARKATQYLYELGLSCGYIKQGLMNKNPYWTCNTPYGPLEISINLAKPEKDPRAIAQAATSCAVSSPSTNLASTTTIASQTASNAKSALATCSNYSTERTCNNSDYNTEEALPPTPACDLCWENEGFPGSPNHPAKPGLRIAEITLGNKRWGLQYSPYAYFNEHCIVLNENHVPMHIDRACFENLFDFVDQFPFYFIGSNADLPIVGGSILSHDHYQGGLHTFPLMNAPVKETFSLALWPNIQTGIVAWPSTVIRLQGCKRKELIEAAEHILLTWKNYSDVACGIICKTDVCHNTLNPILHKKDELYIFDLVLRNNRTTKNYPWGIFHPDESLHHIKKENIGLIEIMGLAILPPRLGKELPEIKQILLTALQNGWNTAQLHQALDNNELCAKHALWACEIFISLQTQYQMSNVADLDNVSKLLDSLLKESIGEIFMRVLKATGVFKNTPEGHSGLHRFLNIL